MNLSKFHRGTTKVVEDDIDPNRYSIEQAKRRVSTTFVVNTIFVVG